MQNGTYTGPATIAVFGSAIATVQPIELCVLPASVSINNATLDWYNNSTGQIQFSNPTGTVEVIAVCEPIAFSITSQITHGLAIGATSVVAYNQATVTIVPD